MKSLLFKRDNMLGMGGLVEKLRLNARGEVLFLHVNYYLVYVWYPLQPHRMCDILLVIYREGAG